MVAGRTGAAINDEANSNTSGFVERSQSSFQMFQMHAVFEVLVSSESQVVQSSKYQDNMIAGV